MEEECDRCHTTPWKYRLSAERQFALESRFCETCFKYALRSLHGGVVIEPRHWGDREL
jgi:hypothetical protein